MTNNYFATAIRLDGSSLGERTEAPLAQAETKEKGQTVLHA
jgi:hypothetical protein